MIDKTSPSFCTAPLIAPSPQALSKLDKGIGQPQKESMSAISGLKKASSGSHPLQFPKQRIIPNQSPFGERSANKIFALHHPESKLK
jgi:hypothetical protein